MVTLSSSPVCPKLKIMLCNILKGILKFDTVNPIITVTVAHTNYQVSKYQVLSISNGQCFSAKLFYYFSKLHSQFTLVLKNDDYHEKSYRPQQEGFISPLNYNFIKFYLIVARKVRMPPNVRRAPSTLYMKRLSVSE